MGCRAKLALIAEGKKELSSLVPIFLMAIAGFV